MMRGFGILFTLLLISALLAASGCMPGENRNASSETATPGPNLGVVAPSEEQGEPQSLFVPGYMWIEDIQGEGPEGGIAVYGMRHNVEVAIEAESGAGPTGPRRHNPLVLIKEYDKASPKLYQALSTGNQFERVEVKWYRVDSNGSAEHYCTQILEDARIISIKSYVSDISGAGSQESYRHMEEISFTYKKIIWTYEPEGATWTEVPQAFSSDEALIRDLLE